MVEKTQRICRMIAGAFFRREELVFKERERAWPLDLMDSSRSTIAMRRLLGELTRLYQERSIANQGSRYDLIARRRRSFDFDCPLDARRAVTMHRESIGFNQL